MSTSPSRAPAAAVADGPQSLSLPPALPEFQPFPYDLIPLESSGRRSANDSFAAADPRGGKIDSGAADTAAREARAQAQGREQGQEESRKIFEEHLARERASIAAALAQFTRDRGAYFEKVEGEVVQLALSIARKILHREAQLDPLLLAGIVRVALEKIDGATGVTLRLNPQNAADWRRYLSTNLDPSDMPQVVEDASQPPDRCILETSMGTALVGLDVQLKEIEQGLMDLLAARPGATP
jgi:flagellar assembly protein FliH